MEQQPTSRKVCNATAITSSEVEAQCSYTNDTVRGPTAVEIEHAAHRSSTEVIRGVPALEIAVLNC
jgi:hypothetical protein